MSTRAADARALALQVLLRVERQEAYLNVALDQVLDSAGAIDRRDAGLCTELAYGTYRRLLTLDAVIAKHCDRPLKKLEDAVLASLRLGVYQLLFLDRVPERAAVAETVNLIKQTVPRAAGFVNAVLRSVGRDRTIPMPDAATDLAGHLEIRESHPRWLIEKYLAQLGPVETEALLRANNVAPPVQVRANLRRGTREAAREALQRDGVESELTTYSPVGLTLVDPGPLEKLPSMAEGLWQVQDEAAQCVGFWSRPEGGKAILDACAAPGGKTCHLLERCDADAKVLALDIHSNKLGKINAEASRLGLRAALELGAHDMTTPLAGKPRFDRIVVDAPCSGLGTLRRHPELRYRREVADLGRLVTLQKAILRNALKHLAPGGLLTYAVCSTAPEEGPLQVEALLAEESRLERVGTGDLPESLRPVMTPEGALSTWPQRHGTDGFYAATVRSR